MTARILPNNQGAESSVLGCILLDPASAMAEVMDLITPDDFYVPAHQEVFLSMLRLEQSGKPIDIVSLGADLSANDQLARAGGVGSIAELSSTVSTAANVRYHAEAVRDKAIIRRAILACSEHAAEGYDDPGDVHEYLDRLSSDVMKLGEPLSSKSVMTARQAMPDVMRAVAHRYSHKDEVVGVPSGLIDLDEKTSGFQGSDLIIIGARPSVGKSALCATVAMNAAIQHGIPVLIFSLEMSCASILERCLAIDSGVDLFKIRTGKLDVSEWTELTRSAVKIASQPISIDDTASPGLSEIKARTRRFRADRAMFGADATKGLVIVDYLQLMRPSSKSGRSREQEVSEMSRGLKMLAKDTAMPIVALSQLRRAVEDRKDQRPQLSDLRESGAIEQDADVIIFIHRTQANLDNGTAQLIVAKQRNGPTGDCVLSFNPRCTRFSNYSERED